MTEETPEQENRKLRELLRWCWKNLDYPSEFLSINGWADCDGSRVKEGREIAQRIKNILEIEDERT